AAVIVPASDLRATDGSTAHLVFPSRTDPAHGGPAWATEIHTAASRGYGTFEARLRTPRASRRTGLVSGFFTYFNDGTDHDLDGIVDNHEIDFEFLASEPSAIYLTVWTEYEDGGGGEVFRKTTRKIDLATGRSWETPVGGEAAYDLVEVAPLPWTAKRYRSSNAFAKYRFAWSAGAVEFAIDLEDGAGWRTLWTLAGTPNVTIPSIPAPLFFNAWHNRVHWDTGIDARVPSGKAILRIDTAAVH
ncbi:MAG: glycoside hydrolase family 16 protein, partial [Alphaproteobacteria bacterium]